MSVSIEPGEFQAHTEQIDRLVQRVMALTDDDARNTALELLQSVMDFHGVVASRIVEVLSAGEAGRTSLAKLGSDPLICGLLVLYGIHPIPLEERIRQALEKARPQLQKHGGSVELLGISDAVVRVNVHSAGHGCGSSPDAIKQKVEQAILEAAPEVVEIVVEGLPAREGKFIPLQAIQPANGEAAATAMIPPAKKEERAYEESTA